MRTIELLDHGYVKLVETWGGDQRVVESARMSTGKGFLGWGLKWRCSDCGCLWRFKEDTWSLYDAEQVPGVLCCDNQPGFENRLREVPGDEKLLRYLYENAHATPFEFAGMVVEVQAPIMVFREWQRHRTQSYNEASARYAPLPNLNYMPTVERIMQGGGHLTRQAGTVDGAAEITHEYAESFQQRLRTSYIQAEADYHQAAMSGVPKELARLHLPVGRYSKMRASANLRNWLAFMTLRMAPVAQWEIRQYANAVALLVAEQFPRTSALFEEKRAV